jgi:hypothetical protein
MLPLIRNARPTNIRISVLLLAAKNGGAKRLPRLATSKAKQSQETRAQEALRARTMGKKEAEQLLYGTVIVSWLHLAAYGLLLLLL